MVESVSLRRARADGAVADLAQGLDLWHAEVVFGCYEFIAVEIHRPHPRTSRRLNPEFRIRHLKLPSRIARRRRIKMVHLIIQNRLLTSLV